MKHIFSSIATVFFFAFFVLTSAAQPAKHHGCHHTHNKGKKRVPLTAYEKVLLNQSIARSDTFDIHSYDITIDVTNYIGHQIIAATKIEVAPLMAGQTSIRFDLFQLQVDSVKDDNGALQYAHDGNILTVQFGTSPAINEIRNITVYYHGNPYQDPTWGGFYFESNYIYNLGIGLTTIPPNFGKVWYPCFDSFVERATYQYHVKSAGTYRAHCQGTFLDEIQLGGDTVIRSFAFNQPIPTHLSAIAVAAYEDYDYVHTGANGDVGVRLTAKSGNLPAMQTALQNVGGAIDALEYWYGPYAWERVGYILTTDGALEIPTNIAYPQYMVGEAIVPNNNLLAHELGHHWWGDMVTPHNHNDMWLKEGPAEYSAHLLTEWLYGGADFVAQVKSNQLDVLKNAHIDDGGFQALSPMPDEWIYGTHTYYKGASVMHNLRGYLGDDLFKQAMTNVQANHMYTDVTPEQFRDDLEAESGYDLHPFFDDQVFSPGFSTFVVDSFATTNTGKGYQVEVHIQQKLRECPQFYHQVPMDITLISADNERQEDQLIMDGQYGNYNFNCSFEPVMVVLNGHNRLNQARMDHEFKVYTDVSLSPIIPYVDFRVNKETVVDSSLIRIEHIWAAPDQLPIGDGIFEISNTHYWIIDGLWNQGDYFSGKVYYNGAETTDLDYALYNGGEQNAVLLYRPNSSTAWELCPDFSLGGGSLSNGDGSFNIDTLRQGQYAFANGDISALVPVAEALSESLLMFPNPVSDVLSIRGNYNGYETALFDILSMDGKLVQRSSGVVNGSFTKEINVSDMESGIYLVRVYTAKGELLGLERVEVARK